MNAGLALPCLAAAVSAAALIAGLPAVRFPLLVARSVARALRWPMPGRLRPAFERLLARAGLRERCDPDGWWVLLWLVAGIAAGLAGIGVAWGDWPAVSLGLAPLTCAGLLHSRLRARSVRRMAALVRELPAGIDVLVLCLEAGASLGAALRIASERGAFGPVQSLFAEVLAQIRAGQPRAVALRRYMERLDVAPVSALFTALIQAETRGMSLGLALRAQSQQCLSERFVRAERAAMQAPVKLLLPLLTCIFPCTFIVIAVPVVARFVGAGAT